MRKNKLLTHALVLVLALALCAVCLSAMAATRSYNVVSGQSVTLSASDWNADVSQIRYTTDDARVAVGNDGTWTIRTYALNNASGNATITVWAVNSMLGTVNIITAPANSSYYYNNGYYNNHYYNNGYYNGYYYYDGQYYPINDNYSYNYNYYYPYYSYYNYYDNCSNANSFYSYYPYYYDYTYNNYYNRYPTYYSTVTRETPEAVFAVGQAKDSAGLANEIANNAVYCYDGASVKFAVKVSNNYYIPVITESAKGVSAVTVKFPATQLKRVGKYGIDGFRVPAANASATLIVTPAMEVDNTYSKVGIEGLEPSDGMVTEVKLTANSKQAGLALDFFINGEDLTKNMLRVWKKKGADYEPVDMTDCKLYSSAVSNDSGDVVYSYRLNVPDLTVGTYALSYR